MAIDQKSGLLGLVTNVGRLNAPHGSLEVADNVVIRKPGVVEPRPGITDLTLGWSPSSSNVNKLWEYDGKPHAYASSGWYQVYSSTKRQLTNASGTVIDPALFRGDLLPVAQARGNCYVGTQKGVLKLRSSTHVAAGDDFLESGYTVPSDFLLTLNSSGSPTALATGYKVAYRAVFKRTDENGLVVRSVPSGAVIVSNTSGGTRNVDITLVTAIVGNVSFNLSYGYGLTDTVEFYRTRAFPTASTIDEEYALIGTSTTAFTDTLTDAQRGAALYTSPSQGGSTSENQRPPACGCLETYKGHVFYGNTVTPFRTVASANISTSDLGGSATGIGYRAIVGTTTSGSPLITAMANTTGLQAGQIVTAWNGATYNFPADTYIVSVDSAAQVTVSANATVSTGGMGLRFVDAIQVDGVWKPIFTTSAGATNIAYTPVINGLNRMAGDTGFSTLVKTYYARSITPPEPRYAYTFVIEQLERSSQSSSATIRATHGDEYSPAIATASGTATSMTRDVFKHGLAWSKRDEPEHVPPLNYSQVGNAKSSVLGLASTRDSLFILKEDGVWRLSGPGGNGTNAWRIDPFDLTTFCVLPQSVQKLNNKIYFLSNKGLVRLNESGVEIVSAPINDEMKRVVYAAQSYFNTNGFYSLGEPPCWGSAVNETESEYMLAIGTTGKNLSGTLVYNETTNAWTSWSLATTGGFAFANAYPRAMAWSPSERSVLLGTTDAYGWVRKLTTPGTDSPLITGYDSRSDGYLAVTISTVTGTNNSYTVTYSAAKLLRTGDIVVDSAGLVFVVTSVTSTTIVVVEGRVNGTTYTAPSTGSGFVAATATATVRARAFVDPSVANKLWSHIKAGFAELRGATALRLTVLSNAAGSSSNASAQVSELVSVPYYRGRTASYRGNDFKMNVPRDHARSRDLWPGVEIQTGLGSWQLDNFSTASMADGVNKPPVSQSGAA